MKGIIRFIKELLGWQAGTEFTAIPKPFGLEAATRAVSLKRLYFF
jgi:hypothetical protein